MIAAGIASEAVRLAEAARALPGRPNVQTLLRWIRRGVLDGAGGRVRLAARKIGGLWFVEPGALAQFSERLTPGALRSADEMRRPIGRPARRRQRHRAAMAELDAAGILR